MQPRRLSFLGVLVVSLLLAANGRRIIDLTSLAGKVAGHSYETRREMVFGEFYTSLRKVAQDLPPSVPITVLLRHFQDVDRGTFIIYYLYPRLCRYAVLGTYRGSSPQSPPDVIAYVDLQRDEQVRVLTYRQVRRENLLRPVVASATPGPNHLRGLLLPFVASAEGAPPNAFKTEAALVSDTAANVTVVLYPSGLEKVVRLEAGRVLILRDLMAQLFGASGTGWLRVSADAPIRVGFWLANAGTGRFTLIPPVVAPRPFGIHVCRGEKLWLDNVSGSTADVTIDGVIHTLAPFGQLTMPCRPNASIEAPSTVFAFASSRETDSPTRFVWSDPP